MRRRRERFSVVLVEEFDVWDDIEFRGEFWVGGTFSDVSRYIHCASDCGSGRTVSRELELLRRRKWSEVGEKRV